MDHLKVISAYEKLVQQVEYIIATLGKRTIVSLAASFLIIIFSIMLIDNWISKFNEQTHQILLSRIALNNLYDLKYNLSAAESAQLGFLINGREMYVMPFNDYVNKVKENMRAIELNFKKVPDISQQQLDLFKSADSKLESKLNEMQTTITLAKAGDFGSAINIVNTDQGLRNIEAFNKSIDELIKQNHANINKKVEIRNDNAFYARCLVILSSFIWLTLVVLVIKQMMKEMTSKEKLKLNLKQEIIVCEKKLRDQNIMVRTLALDYQADVERERHKLSSELHDELGAVFTATKMDISWIIKKLKSPNAEVTSSMMIEKLDKTTQYINKGISFHRHLIQELHPVGLSTFGIWATLETLIKDAAERNNWTLTLELPDINTPLDETIGLVAYRLMQETLNNANKYAKADALSVIVIMDDKYLKIEIEDNGVGLDLTAEKKGTYGISGMQNRILAIGGDFEITSELGKGVFTRALIPLKVMDN